MARDPNDPWAFDPSDPYAGLDPSMLDPTASAPNVPSAGDATAGRTAVQAAAVDNPDAPPVETPAPTSTPTDPNNPMAPGNQPSAAGVGAPGNATDQIASYYTQFLGRAGNADEIQGWLNSGLDLGGIQNAIANSAEAKAYAVAHGFNNPPPGTDTGTTTGGTGGTGGTGNTTADSLIAALMARLSGLTAAAPINTQLDPEIRSKIMSAISMMIDQGSQPIGDVSQSQQAKAYQIASQRNAEQDRSAAMERRAAQGLLTSGPAETDVNAIDQQRSEKQSAFEAQLTTTLLADRSQKLTTALQTGAGIMSADQQAALQAELQSVNSELAKSSLQLQLTNSILSNSHFYDDLGYRIGSTAAGLNASAGSSLI